MKSNDKPDNTPPYTTFSDAEKENKIRRDATAAQEGACNSIAVANALARHISDLSREGKDHAAIANHPGIRLIAHQLAHLLNLSEFDRSIDAYSRALNHCDVKQSYVFEHDPAHGWLGVEVSELEQLGIRDKITPYSYFNARTGTVWLEEDQDMSTFLRAKLGLGDSTAPGNEVTRFFKERTTDKYVDGESRIRNMPAFCP